jgi:hypothetical protein
MQRRAVGVAVRDVRLPLRDGLHRRYRVHRRLQSDLPRECAHAARRDRDVFDTTVCCLRRIDRLDAARRRVTLAHAAIACFSTRGLRGAHESSFRPLSACRRSMPRALCSI